MRAAILTTFLATLALGEPANHAPRIESIRDDARAGTVIDGEGEAFVRPPGRTRATAIGQHAVLLAGDVVRTGSRGAHALEVALGRGDGGRVVLGPATEVRFTAEGIELVRGDLAVEPSDRAPIRVGVPGGAAREHTAVVVLRAGDAGIAPLAAAPAWLTAWRSSTAGGRTGALIAQIDGRGVPLAVESHVVDVTVRDQIAETVVEQVFRNHTDAKLEGTFRFTLPDGASLSGFEVWLGGRPVAADIVERGRARQIYEELKQRREDPALLEWSGGNLFTASVWPIPANSSKRLRIRYTEVLPLVGDTLRYRAPLATELLQAQRLATLRVRIAVQSAVPIAAVSSPTHAAVIDRRDHAARVELALDGERPDRDFELAVRLAERAPLTVVDHRRGDEGWFLALLTPPGDAAAADGWRRPLVPDGAPLDLTLIVDTSGSMHGDARRDQLAILAALLDQLGERDRVRIASADAGLRFATPDSTPVTDAVRAAALDFVADRMALGWTDPVTIVRDALAATPAGGHVVYLGDGIPSATAIDAGAVARQIRGLAADTAPTCHAVSISANHERVVLDAIASLGGGVRADGSRPAGDVARDLLTRIASPAWRDLRIRLDGASYARLLPDPLPALPLGTQQLVVGRYLPRATPIAATLIAEGRIGGETRRVEQAITLGAGAGNDFLPRLWAVQHCAALLADGSNPRVADEVIALSSEYGFLTPLTSMLVVDDPEERARYGLERRIAMRDGERFFANAREAAADDVVADARRWRAAARAAALEEIRGLGRDRQPNARTESLLALGEKAGAPAQLATRTLFHDGQFAPGAEADQAFAAWSGAEVTENAFDSNHWNDAVGLGGAYLDADADPEAGRAVLPAGLMGGGLEARRGPADRAPAGMFGPPPPPADPLDGFGFPTMPEAPLHRQPVPGGMEPAAAFELLRGLDRRAALAAVDGPVLFQLRDEILAGRAGRVAGRRQIELMWSVGAWTRRVVGGPADLPQIDWLHGDVRARMFAGIELGRSRPATDADRSTFPLDLPDHAHTDLLAARAGWRAERRDAGDRIELLLEGPPGTGLAERWVFDAATRLPLAFEARHHARLTARSEWSDPVEARGVRCMTRRLDFDHRGVAVRRQWLRMVATDAALVAPETGPFVVGALPTVAAALDAVARDAATPADQLALLADARARDQLTTLGALWSRWNPAPESLGARWIAARLHAGRRDPDAAQASAQALLDAASRATGDVRAPLTVAAESQLAEHRDADERVALHEALRDAWSFAADPWQREQGALRWQLRHAELLAAAGRADEALAVWAAITARSADVLELTLGREDALWSADRADTALGVLREALSRDAWTRGERDALHARLVDRLAGRHDHAAAATAAEAWIRDGAEDAAAWQHHLAALLLQGRVGAVDAALDAVVATAAARTEPRADATATRVARAELAGVADFVRGDGAVFQRWRTLRPVEAERLGLLIAAARTEPSLRELARTWATDHRFRETTVAARMVAALADELRAGLPAGADLGGVRFAVALGAAAALTASERDALVAALLARADVADHPALAREAADLAVEVATAPRADELRLGVLRARVAAAAHAPWRDTDLAALDAALAALPWTADREAERLAVARARLALEVDPRAARLRAAELARELADSLVTARVAAALGPVAELELLPRRERRAAELAAERAERGALAEVFAAVATTEPADRALPWSLEAACFATEAGARPRARDLAVGVWNDVVARGEHDELAVILRDRAGLVLAHTAVQRGAEPDFVDAVVATVRALATGGDEQPRRRALARLWIALDRPDALADAIDGWLAAGALQRDWRELRARLAAEAARFDAALVLLAPLDATPLGPTADGLELRAGCLTALGRDAEARAALAQAVDARSTDDLAALVHDATTRARRGPDGAPERPRDVDVLAAISMTARRADPGEFDWRLRMLWSMSGDFRAIAAWAASLRGLSTPAAAARLAQIRSALRQARSEAEFDEFARALDASFGPAASPRDILHRTLLEIWLGKTLRDVPNRFGEAEQVVRGLDALVAQLRGSERIAARDARAIAHTLTQLENLGDPAARAARRTALETLLARVGDDHWLAFDLRVAMARALWSDARQDLAIAAAEALVAEARGDGPLPARAGPALGLLIGWLEDRGRFVAAERLLASLRAAADPADVASFDARLDALHTAALRARAATSLGEREALLQGLVARIAARLDADGADAGDASASADPAELVARIVAAHHAAATAGVPGAVASLVDFAARLPAIVRRAPLASTQMLHSVAIEQQRLGATREAIRMLARACREQPEWFDTIARDAWRETGYLMAAWRREHPQLGDVEPLLREVVLAALRQSLRDRVASASGFWNLRSDQGWDALRDEFLRIADDELRLAADDPEGVLWIATQVAEDLADRPRAIAALRALESSRGELARDARRQLASWLEAEGDHAAALAAVERLAPDSPLDLDLQLAKARLLGKLGRRDAAREVFAELIAWLDERGVAAAWQHARIAEATRHAGLHDLAERQFDLAIRGRARERRVTPDALLSRWQTARATSLLALGQVEAAVEVAAAAVVSSTEDDDSRAEALVALQRAIAALADLDAWLARWDAEVLATGTDAPVIRRAVAAALRGSDPAAALAQYRIAAELVPGDRDTLRAVVDLLVQLDREAEAIVALHTAALAARDDAARWLGELADRLGRLGRGGDAERARTQLVEALPRDADGRVRLAAVFTELERFDDAVRQQALAVELRPDVAEHWLAYVAGLLRAGDRAAAERAVDAMFARDWGAQRDDLRDRATRLLAGR